VALQVLIGSHVDENVNAEKRKVWWYFRSEVGMATGDGERLAMSTADQKCRTRKALHRNPIEQ
jgi:hypothetical protein